MICITKRAIFLGMSSRNPRPALLGALLFLLSACPSPEVTSDAGALVDAPSDAGAGAEDVGLDAPRADTGPDAGPPMGFEEELDYWMNAKAAVPGSAGTPRGAPRRCGAWACNRDDARG